jgi:hypothetical protein
MDGTEAVSVDLLGQDGRRGIAFVVPVRNGAAHLAPCLDSIKLASVGAPCEIIVVDNGSTDGSAQIAAASGARVLLLPGRRVGAVRNAGARAASADVLAFVDADHEIDQGWVRACVDVFSDPSIGAAGSPYHAPQPPTWVQRFYDLLRARSALRADVLWLGAGNLAVRRALFLEIGGFDERLEACEDVALCDAIVQAGFRIVAEPGMRSVHHGDPATLRALLVGEMWRGRDNLRVSLGGSWRARAGALVPLASLLLVATLLGSTFSAPWLGWIPALAAAGGLMAIACRRTAEIIRRGRLSAPLLWLQGFVVALTFEVARGLALLGAATHSARRRIGSA